MFCANLDISAEDEEGPIYDTDKRELLSPPMYGTFNLIVDDRVKFDRSFLNLTQQLVDLSYHMPNILCIIVDMMEMEDILVMVVEIINMANLRLYNYKVDNMTNLTEVLTGTSAENILILMREYDGEVNDSYFIQYSAPEFDDYTTIRPALSLFDPSIFKTVTDNYFVLNTK